MNVSTWVGLPQGIHLEEDLPRSLRNTYPFHCVIKIIASQHCASRSRTLADSDYSYLLCTACHTIVASGDCIQEVSWCTGLHDLQQARHSNTRELWFGDPFSWNFSPQISISALGLLAPAFVACSTNPGYCKRQTLEWKEATTCAGLLIIHRSMSTPI